MAKHFKNHILNSSGSANMDADVYSTTVELRPDQTKFSFQVVCNNTNAVGSIKVQESNDNANWVTVTFNSGATSYGVTSGTDINQTFHIESYCRHCRVWYDFTSGDGILDIYARIVG